MPFTEAAAIPEAFLTGWDALVARGRVAPGERVLIHAVGSGVGTAAVQLARRLGAVTVGTSRSSHKLDRARVLGLDEAIDTSAGRFRDRLSGPVNIILDVLGGPAFAENLDALAPRGRLVLLGFLQSAKVEASLEPILRKRLEVIGSVMRTRGLEERIALARDFSDRVLPWFEARRLEPPSGRADQLRPVVGERFDFGDIAAAHAAMEQDRSFGKIVLAWG
jgi:NADPH:quinone reductase-like Zn-dependent oxidoreductase